MKKLLSCLVSIGVLASIMTSFGASSAFNPNKDPNGDGHMTLADAAYIYQSLYGNYKPTNLTELDVNDNNVVSDVDAVYVQMHDAGVVTMALPHNDSNIVNTNTNNRTYNVYTAGGGVFRRSYTLSVANDENVASTNSVIGSDERVIDWTKSGVVKLYTNFNYGGTGFVVGPHTIATAAHCLVDYSDLSRSMISDIKFFDSNGNDINFNVTPIEYHIPVDYISSNGNGSDTYTPCSDYALITVQEDLSDYNIFNLGMMTNTFNMTQPISVTGFPQKYLGEVVNDFYDHLMCTGAGHFNGFGNSHLGYNNDLLLHDVDTSSGNSGSPIYITESVNGQVYFTVIGIHISGANKGTRIDSELLKFYKGNPHLEY